eukprot:4912293-Amphidinium_carterae.1
MHVCKTHQAGNGTVKTELNPERWSLTHAVQPAKEEDKNTISLHAVEPEQDSDAVAPGAAAASQSGELVGPSAPAAGPPPYLRRSLNAKRPYKGSWRFASSMGAAFE